MMQTAKLKQQQPWLLIFNTLPWRQDSHKDDQRRLLTTTGYPTDREVRCRAQCPAAPAHGDRHGQ